MQQVIMRDDLLSEISNLAETTNVRNQAFLGLKGVGKTQLLQTYFTSEKIRSLTKEYNNVFVYTRLDNKKSGEDFYLFLFEQVITGIESISDDDDREKLLSKVESENVSQNSIETRLSHILNAIKTLGYRLILIMDHFHCMARDTEIGQDQYDTLRGFNQQNQMLYWIVTDTSLIDKSATKQYHASFFEQNFTKKLTISPICDTERNELIKKLIELDGIHLEDEEIDFLANLTGGVPKLVSMIIDLLPQLQNEYDDINGDIVEFLLEHNSCTSLMRSWSDGLASEQKMILYTIATECEGIVYKENLVDYSIKTTQLAELSDSAGRGLLTSIRDDEDRRRWEVTVPLYGMYIRKIGEDFWKEGEKENVAVTEGEMKASGVTNVNYGPTYYIQNQTNNNTINNTINIKNAVAGLENLQRLIQGNGKYLEVEQLSQNLEYLPFKQDAWLEMNPEEQEEEIEKYADEIFNTDSFSKRELTVEQKTRFSLTDDILYGLSTNCREQIICGIQVYDLIQTCIDRFGLKMNESESARGILFARAFERHMKDCVYPAFCRLPYFAKQTIPLKGKQVKVIDFPVMSTTIGNYTKILADGGYKQLAEITETYSGEFYRDLEWWKNQSQLLKKIGNLRNDCCHSGTAFDYMKLNELNTYIFKEHAIETILLFKNIQVPTNSVNKTVVASSNMPMQLPDLSLIGKKVTFLIQKKGANGNFQGVVNGKYMGSLPRRYASQMIYVDVKNTTINVVIETVQDNRYVLKIDC